MIIIKKFTKFSFLCSSHVNIFHLETLYTCGMHPYEHTYKTYDFFKLQTMVFENFKIEAPKFLTRKTYQINRNAIAKLAIISNLPKSATILEKCNPLICT